MAKYQGYAQRKAYQGSKANLQQPRFQSRFDQDEFAAQQAPLEGLTRLQEFHNSVVKSADQHRKEVYNIATDYLTQTKQNQANEAKVVQQNAQLERNRLTHYENALTQNQNVHAANAKLEIAEIKSRSEDLQDIISGVSKTLQTAEDKRREAIRKRINIEFHTPGSIKIAELKRNLNITDKQVELNDKLMTNLALQARKDGASPTVVTNISKPSTWEEFYFLKEWTKSTGNELQAKLNSKVNLLEESERTKEKLQELGQELLNEYGFISNDGKQPYVLGNELMSNVLEPLNKSIKTWEQTFENEETDRQSIKGFNLIKKQFTNDPTNSENNLNDALNKAWLSTEGGEFRTRQEALQMVGDLLSTIDPKYYHLYKNQIREGIGGKWSIAKIGDQFLFDYARDKWNERIEQERKHFDRNNKNQDYLFSQEAVNGEIDLPEDEKLNYWVNLNAELIDKEKTNPRGSLSKSRELIHSKINFYTEYNLGQQDLSKVIPHMQELSRMGMSEQLIVFIDNHPTLNKQQKEFLRHQYIPKYGEQSYAGINDSGLRKVFKEKLKQYVKETSPSFEPTLDIIMTEYYTNYAKYRDNNPVNGPMPYDLLKEISGGEVRNLIDKVEKGVKDPNSQYYVYYDRNIFKEAQFFAQTPNTEKAKKARQQIKMLARYQKQASDVQGVPGFEPTFNKEEITEIHDEIGELQKQNLPIDWKEILPNHIITALAAEGIPISTFINHELKLAGLTTKLPYDTRDHVLYDVDSYIQPNLAWYAGTTQTIANLINLDRFKSKRNEWLQDRKRGLGMTLIGGI